MKRHFFLLFFLLITSSFISNTNAQKSRLRRTSSTPTRTKSVSDEAFEEGQKFWNKVIVACDGNYYFRSQGIVGDIFYECKKKPILTMKGREYPPRQLSEAERLNGVDPQPIAWQGNAYVETGLCRSLHIVNGVPLKWGPWFDFKDMWVGLRKEKGQWRLGGLRISGDNERAITFDCSFLEEVNNSLNGKVLLTAGLYRQKFIDSNAVVHFYWFRFYKDGRVLYSESNNDGYAPNMRFCMRWNREGDCHYRVAEGVYTVSSSQITFTFGSRSFIGTIGPDIVTIEVPYNGQNRVTVYEFQLLPALEDD